MRGLRNSYVVVRGKSKWNIHALHSKHTKGIHTKYIHHRSLKSTFVWKIAIFNSHQISNFGLFTEFDLCSETVTYCWLICSDFVTFWPLSRIHDFNFDCFMCSSDCLSLYIFLRSCTFFTLGHNILFQPLHYSLSGCYILTSTNMIYTGINKFLGKLGKFQLIFLPLPLLTCLAFFLKKTYFSWERRKVWKSGGANRKSVLDSWFHSWNFLFL